MTPTDTTLVGWASTTVCPKAWVMVVGKLAGALDGVEPEDAFGEAAGVPGDAHPARPAPAASAAAPKARRLSGRLHTELFPVIRQPSRCVFTGGAPAYGT